MHYLYGQWTAMLNMKGKYRSHWLRTKISIPSNGKKGDKIWQSSEYFMNVFCNNALPAPSPGEEYPSAWTNIMMFLPGGQDFIIRTPIFLA